MKKNLSDILGVFTNGDADNIDSRLVKTLKNFRPINGKLVKTHGSADTKKFSNLKSEIGRYTITNLFTFSNDHLSKENHRSLVVKVDNATQNVVLEFSNGL